MLNWDQITFKTYYPVTLQSTCDNVEGRKTERKKEKMKVNMCLLLYKINELSVNLQDL